MDEVIHLTFEDWQNRRLPPSLDYLDKAFGRALLSDEKEEWRLYSLSEREFEKIAKAQNRIFEASVDFFLQEEIRRFEQKFDASFEKTAFVNDELQRINQVVSDDNFSYGYAFPYGENGVALIGATFGGMWKKEGEADNLLAYWYRRIIIRAERKAPGFIKGQKGEIALNVQIAIHVLHRYKQYLENRLVVVAAPSVGDSRPLFLFFHGSKELDLALKAATNTGLISEAGKWGHIGHKTKAISVFWRAAVKAELAKADAPIYKVIEAVKEQFSEYFGQNAIDKKREIAAFGDEYKELYKSLLAIMRP